MVRALHSRYSLAVAAIIAVCCAIAFSNVASLEYPLEGAGFVKSWSLGLINPSSANISLCIGLAVNISIALLMAYINKAFNVLRNMTMLQSSLFLIFEVATPSLLLFATPGSFVCLILMLSLVIMYASYGRPDFQRPIFLVFFMLSALGTIDYASFVYIPVMWLGLAQMRTLSLRTVLASLMGIATPWIILFGFGIITFSDVWIPPLFSSFRGGALEAINTNWLMLCTAFLTFLLGIGALLQNMIKIISYKAQYRAMIGLLTLMLLFTIVAMSINLGHFATFVPVLDCCAAWQLGHLFGAIHRQKGSKWIIFSISAIYLAIFTFRTLSCIL